MLPLQINRLRSLHYLTGETHPWSATDSVTLWRVTKQHRSPTTEHITSRTFVFPMSICVVREHTTRPFVSVQFILGLSSVGHVSTFADLIQSNQAYLMLNRARKLCATVPIVMLTSIGGKTGIAQFINHNLKETASTVLQRLLIKNGVTVIPPNPIQSMAGCNWCPTLVCSRDSKTASAFVFYGSTFLPSCEVWEIDKRKLAGSSPRRTYRTC